MVWVMGKKGVFWAGGGGKAAAWMALEYMYDFEKSVTIQTPA